MATPIITLYGPRMTIACLPEVGLRLLCDEFDEKSGKSAIVTIDLPIARAREWTLLMRGWLKIPDRETLTFVTIGRDQTRSRGRTREVKVEVTFPRGQVREVLPLLEGALGETASSAN